MNSFISTIFDFLKEYYSNRELPKGCFMNQLKQVEEATKVSPYFHNIKTLIKAIDKNFACDDEIKVEEVDSILREFDNNRQHVYIQRLNQTLRTEFYQV